MDKKTLTTIVATAVISSTTPTNADTLKDNDINKIVCTTKQSCEKLSNSIQTQINELESKGEENLTDNEIDRYLSLQKSLIAVENQKQIIEDKKHLVQNKLIAEENNKQETQDKIHQNQEILKKVNQEQIKEQLTSIKGSFL